MFLIKQFSTVIFSMPSAYIPLSDAFFIVKFLITILLAETFNTLPSKSAFIIVFTLSSPINCNPSTFIVNVS